MNSSKTNESDIKDVAVQASEQPKEKKKSAPRSDISAENKKIIKFLSACEPYQADAVRVIAVFAANQAKPTTFSDDDAVYVNRFLNSGIEPSQLKSVDDLMAHRRTRMNKLLFSTNCFCEHRDVQRVMMAVMNLAIDANVGKTAYEQLKKLTFNQ
jgi:leucyl-tRNA synthetase